MEQMKKSQQMENQEMPASWMMMVMDSMMKSMSTLKTMMVVSVMSMGIMAVAMVVNMLMS